jgi:hypothetical protein
MALCLAESLLIKNGFDALDQMTRYVRWYRSGYLSPTGRCFDIGRTVEFALRRFEKTGDPYAGSTSPDSAGNGALMRLAPVAIRYFRNAEALDHFAVESSRTTHAAPEALDTRLRTDRCAPTQSRPSGPVATGDPGADSARLLISEGCSHRDWLVLVEDC